MNALLKNENGEEILEAFVQDITAYKKAQDDLTQLNEELEARVISRTHELTGVNNKLLGEISVRKQVQKQLRKAKESAENANRSKDKYLAAASHDLLQPMNAARLLVSTLRERELSEENNHLVELIHLALEGAEDLLNDLLYISKLDQNAVQPQIEVFSIQQLLASLEGEFYPMAKDQQLPFHVLPCRLTVRSDARLLGRILRNFISNAFRYTSSGRILVGCRRRRGDRLSIQVWDTGVGVPEKLLPEIFREFHQLNTRQRGMRKGVGLGLAIVDRLSRMLNHRIEVKSWANCGSVFSIEVPLTESRVITHSQHGLVLPLNNLEGICVLVLDNDENILTSMQLLLKQWGCVVYLARDEYEAIMLCKAESLKPDLILADYHLDENQNGIDAVMAMRKCAGSKIPAAIITADYSDELNLLFRRLQMPVLNKPVKPAKLRAVLSHFVQHRDK